MSTPVDDFLESSSVHKITAGHRSLSGAISRVTDRIRYLPVTGHNDRQVFKFQYYIIYRRPAPIVSDRHKVPTAGHVVRHWRNIYFRRWMDDLLCS